jgi:histidyl-tRNA synthetase
VALLLGEKEFSHRPDLFMATMGAGERAFAFRLMHELLQQGLRVEMDYEGMSLKSQMRRADKLNARYSVVIGESELASGRATFKQMADGQQIECRLIEADVQELLRR